MPEILINGEKKKVACGPCIRGHRSSKCNHKDRVLIEVRKPGRPLSTCPHPEGSCSCERVVISYTIPKTSDCPCPPQNATSSTKVQKPRTRKPSITPSGLQKAINDEPAILRPAEIQPAPSASSETSSNGPSISSSTSSTPRSARIDGHTGNPPGTPFSPATSNVEHRPVSTGSQPAMMPTSGYAASSDGKGWNSEWRNDYTHQQAVVSEQTYAPQAQSSCCSKSQQTRPTIPQPDSTTDSSCCPSQQSGAPLQFQTTAGNTFAVQETPINQFIFGGQMFEDQDFAQFEKSTCVSGNHGDINADQHDCHCGDGCLCIGCATHPQNRSTLEYVRYHNELAMRTPYAQPTLGIFPTPQFSALSLMASMGHSNGMAYPMAQTQFYPGSNHMHTADPAFAFAYNETSQWAFAQSGPQLQQTPTLELENFHLYPDPTLTQTNGLHNGKASSQKASTSVQPKARLWQPPNLKFEHEAMERGRMNGWSSAPEPPHDFIEPPSPEDDDSTSTLSPSSFLPLSVTLEGCNEGACHCGDGCECDGCLVHRGHVEQPRMHVPL